MLPKAYYNGLISQVSKYYTIKNKTNDIEFVIYFKNYVKL